MLEPACIDKRKINTISYDIIDTRDVEAFRSVINTKNAGMPGMGGGENAFDVDILLYFRTTYRKFDTSNYRSTLSIRYRTPIVLAR